MDKRIFVAQFPCGFSYCDTKVERNGDYKRLAFLPYSTLVLDVEKDCPKVLAEQIRQHAGQYKKGDKIRVSTSQDSYHILGEMI